MKKVIIMAIVAIVSATTVSAQDTTGITLVDSNRIYQFNNVYARIDNITILAPFRNILMFRSLKDTINNLKWLTRITIKVYASKVDYLANKGELFSRYAQELYTDKFPTQKDILDRMRISIK